MRDRGIEALLVTRPENVRYLTGFTGSNGSVLVSQRRPVLVTDFRYKLQAAGQARGVRVLIQKKDWQSAVAEAARRAGADVLSFDETSLTHERIHLLKKQGLRLKPGKDAVAELRRIKDERELAAIRTAIRRAEESFRELESRIRPGAKERDLALALELLMREKGSRRAAFDIIVASGRNGAMPHASVSDRRLRAGDLVTVDFGAEADGYVCDITRTLCVGRPTARQREIHDLVRRAQQAAMDAVRPGLPCKGVDKAARDIIDAAGHKKHFGHGTGHGVGLLVHEGPTVSALSKDAVQEGMVFTVEPGVYIPGWGGVRIEDMVLVTEQGAKLLTTLPREL
jgi:Xaa-Pro aminopeptidase